MGDLAVGLVEFLRQGARRIGQVLALQFPQDFLCEPFMRLILGDPAGSHQEPLARLSGATRFGAESSPGQIGFKIARQSPVEPGRALGGHLRIDRQCREDMRFDGRILRALPFVLNGAVEIILRHRPGSVFEALRVTCAADRL